MRIIERSARLLSPVWTAFFGSLALSLVSIVCSPTINRDGILYVETARIFLKSGVSAAFQSFDWPFFSVLMAGVAQLAGIGIETTGFILCALFMAGVCALSVAITRQAERESEWWACLTILALGGINNYRDELVREFGYWFFSLLGLWLAVRWSERQRWISVLAAQCCVLFAFLFRPEALAFLAAMFFWQLFSLLSEGKARRTLMIISVPLLMIAAVAVAIGLGGYELGGRLSNVLHHLDFGKMADAFEAKAQALSQALIPYARDQAGKIVLMGSLAIIPLKFFGQLGLFVVPLTIVVWRSSLTSLLARQPLLAWAFAVQLFVLSTFVVNMQFLAGRYVATLGLIAAPFVAIGLRDMVCYLPRWKYLIVLIAIVVMLDNVVSLHPGSNYFRDAGEWLSLNARDTSRVYVEGSRTAYYAGWNTRQVFQKEHREQLGQSLALDRYDLLALEVSRRDADTDRWLKSRNLRVVEKFRNSRGDSVVIAAPEYLNSH